MTTQTLVAYSTLQFQWGGLFDGKPQDGLVHLVRVASGGGTPGPTLCGIDRFAVGAPGFSVGGGLSDVDTPCTNCAGKRHPDVPLKGLNAHAFGDQS